MLKPDLSDLSTKARHLLLTQPVSRLCSLAIWKWAARLIRFCHLGRGSRVDLLQERRDESPEAELMGDGEERLARPQVAARCGQEGNTSSDGKKASSVMVSAPE